MAFYRLDLRAFGLAAPVEHVVLVERPHIVKPLEDIELVLSRRYLGHRIERTGGLRHPDALQLALGRDKHPHGIGLDVVETNERTVLTVLGEIDDPDIADGIGPPDVAVDEIGVSNLAVGIGLASKNWALVGAGFTFQGIVTIVEEVKDIINACKTGNWEDVNWKSWHRRLPLFQTFWNTAS